MSASDEEMMVLGRAVHAEITKPGQWPKVLCFELWDHKRRLSMMTLDQRLHCSDPNWSDIPEGGAKEVAFPQGMF